MVFTHCLADACVSRLIYAAYEDPAREGDVEAEVDQHVPKLAAHTDRPGVTETNSRIKTGKRSVVQAFLLIVYVNTDLGVVLSQEKEETVVC